MDKNRDLCSDCEVFKNYEQKEKAFAFGFFCPIEQKFVSRNNSSCENILSDKLPF